MNRDEFFEFCFNAIEMIIGNGLWQPYPHEHGVPHTNFLLI